MCLILDADAGDRRDRNGARARATFTLLLDGLGWCFQWNGRWPQPQQHQTATAMIIISNDVIVLIYMHSSTNRRTGNAAANHSFVTNSN